MRLLLVLPAPRCVYLTIGRMSGWTQSFQEGWRLHLLKHPHRTLTDKGLEMPLLLTVLEATALLRS